MAELDKKYLDSADGKLCVRINKNFSRCVDLRQNFERQWYLNIAFYYGRQWVGWNGVPGAGKYTLMDYPVRSRSEVRVVANKIQPVIRNELTKLTKEEPQWYVIPATAENEDLAAARAAELISESIMDVGGYNRARREATWWSLLCGTGYLTQFPMGGQAGEYGKIIPDKIKLKKIPTFNIYVPNLQEEDIEEQPYVMHVYMADPAALSHAYKCDVPTEELPTGADFQTRLLQMMGVNNSSTSKGALVKEVYIKPNHEFPEGAFLISSGGKLLYMNEKLEKEEVRDEEGNVIPDAPKKWVRPKKLEPDEEAMHKGLHNSLGYKTAQFPFAHGQYPFSKIDHIPSGRFYGLSVIEGLIAIQKEYNRARSQIRMGANRTSSPQWTYEIGSLEDPRKLNNEPGIAIPYRSGFKPPAPIQNPEYPSYAIQDQERILKDLDDFSGQYEVSHGRTPPGVEAASAIAYLQEENDTRLYHTAASIEEATQKTGFQVLSMVQQFWSAEKIIKVTSRNNKDDVDQFKVADMNDNTDFRVEPGSMAPKSRAARQAMIMELMKGGYIDPKDGLQYLQMVETNRLWEDMQLDSRQVQRENMLFKKNGDVSPHSYDNHELHIMYHQKWMKTQDFDLLPKEIKERVELHVQAHKLELIKPVPGEMPGTELGAEDPNVNGPGTEPGVVNSVAV